MMEEKFVLKNIAGIWFGFSPLLEQLGVNHVFTTKFHGGSTIIENSLNLSLHVEDCTALVVQNRENVCQALQLDFEKLTTPRQVHGVKSVYVDANLRGSGNRSFDKAIADTDALFTDREGIPLMLLFADCTPVIISEPMRKVVAVVHAGWRGTLQGIVRKTLQMLREQLAVEPENCYALIGPSIGPCCYQVGEEVYNCAKEKSSAYQQFFSVAGEKQWLFDLWQLNANQLVASGLKRERIIISDVCTQCNKELFFSHRADQGKTGRFAAIAWL